MSALIFALMVSSGIHAADWKPVMECEGEADHVRSDKAERVSSLRIQVSGKEGEYRLDSFAYETETRARFQVPEYLVEPFFDPKRGVFGFVDPREETREVTIELKTRSSNWKAVSYHLASFEYARTPVHAVRAKWLNCVLLKEQG